MRKILLLLIVAFATGCNKSEDNAPTVLKIGQDYENGIVFRLNETKQHGLLLTKETVGYGDWSQALVMCSNYKGKPWRLPTSSELKEIADSFGNYPTYNEGNYWSQTSKPTDSVYIVNFKDGKMSAAYVKANCWVCGVREF